MARWKLTKLDYWLRVTKQKEGIDYEKTYSLVAMIKSIRILLPMTTYYDYEIWHMDVKTTFLNGHLQEEIYME